MCGIVGILAYGRDVGPVERAELLRIRDAMLARGPDAAGLWISENGTVGLGHRRLSIIDLSDAGAQPMATADGRLRVVFNGEIYNYPELRRELEAKGYQFRSHSDTEVLLHLYTDQGAAMVERLRGMFAFALWDEQRRGLLLARDPFGIKPLYYADDGHVLRAASQVKALLKADIDARPDPAGRVGFYLWGYVPEPYTLYAGIRALPAGATLWIDQDRRREQRVYCDISRELGRPVAGGAASPGALRERLHDLLLDSVRHHLLADVPVGVFLSSGLDSSTITALAVEAAHEPLHTVTLGFNEYRGTDNDEAPLAERLAAWYGTAHQTRWVKAQDFEDELPALLAAMDQPTIDGVNTYFVSKATREAGLKVALSGLGGDELFGSYGSFRDIPRMVGALAALQRLRGVGVAFRRVSGPLLKHFTSPKYAGLLEYGGAYSGAYLLRRGLFMPWELPGILDADLVRAGWQELQTLARLEETCRDLPSSRLKVSALEMGWYMRSQLLRDADWAGMAHSLEIRVPLVDVSLLRELAPLLAQAGPPSKSDMARVPARPLPPEIVNQRKRGFSVPVREWLMHGQPGGRHDRGLRDWAKLVMAAATGDQRGALPAEGVPARRWTGIGPLERAGPAAPLGRFGYRATNVLQRGINGMLDLTRWLLWPRPMPRAPKRICIQRVGVVGDILCSIPAMVAIREAFPDAEITLLTTTAVRGLPGAQELLEGADWLDHILVYYPEDLRTWASMREFIHDLRARRFDLWFHLPQNLITLRVALRNMIFVRLVGVSWATGFRVSNLRWLNRWLARHQAIDPDIPRELERQLCSLGELGIASDGVSFPLPISAVERDEARRLLRTHGLDEAPLLAVSPGAKRALNRWPAERFAEVARRWTAAGGRVVVLGGASDHEAGVLIAAACGDRAANLCGSTTLMQSAELMRYSDLVVSNDSGPMHLAAAVGQRCVAIFSGWQSPRMWAPWGGQHTVLRREVPCSPCLLEECPNNNICLTEIGVEEVWQHVQRLAGASLPGTGARQEVVT